MLRGDAPQKCACDPADHKDGEENVDDDEVRGHRVLRVVCWARRLQIRAASWVKDTVSATGRSHGDVSHGLAPIRRDIDHMRAMNLRGGVPFVSS